MTPNIKLIKNINYSIVVGLINILFLIIQSDIFFNPKFNLIVNVCLFKAVDTSAVSSA